jgi:hypothetical protein
VGKWDIAGVLVHGPVLSFGFLGIFALCDVHTKSWLGGDIYVERNKMPSISLVAVVGTCYCSCYIQVLAVHMACT